jgi:DNA-binding transcriptional LysR family regulator
MLFISIGDDMNLRAIDLNLLPVFEAVYVERSLTRAGEVLNVTQPAVSNALARLRAAFGDPLFVRAGRGVAPTPKAQTLIAPVREALTRLRSGLDPASAFHPGTADRAFNIASRDASSSVIIPRLAKRLEKAAPGVRLHCHVVERHDVPLELASGRLDFAFDLAVLARPELDSAPLFSDRWVCALRKDHPNAKRKLSLKAFLGLRHLVTSSRRQGRTVVDEALSRIGEKIRPAIRLPHYQPAFHAVMSSDLALVAPLSLAERYDVAVRDLPFDVPGLDLLLFWRRDSAQEPAIRWLRAELLAAASPKGLGLKSTARRGRVR